MKSKWIAISALAVSLGATSGAVATRAYAAPAGTPAVGASQEGRWNEPPSEYREVERQGYRDGVEAARRDLESRRHRDADDHEMYRHPRVERELRDDYRRAFRSGYERAMQHMREERHEQDEPHS